MITKIIIFLEILVTSLMFLIFGSSELGFKIMKLLVIIVTFIDRVFLKLKSESRILDPGYIKLWLPFIILAALAVIAIYGIWYELRKKNIKGK